eukprot:403369735
MKIPKKQIFNGQIAPQSIKRAHNFSSMMSLGVNINQIKKDENNNNSPQNDQIKQRIKSNQRVRNEEYDINPAEIVKIQLNGLYQSSNPNLHKHRDYDPFLSNFVKLKQFLPGTQRAQKAQQEHQNNYIVNQGHWNNGPVKIITRDRSQILESKTKMEYGTKPISDPQNRQLICRPNWREHTKQKWMDSKDFKIATKNSHFRGNQAWEEPTVGDPNGITDPYEDGVEAIGNNRRPRKIISEMDYNDTKDAKQDQKLHQGFHTSTNKDYMFKGKTLLQSSSHRTLDAQIFQKQAQQMQKQLIKQNSQTQINDDHLRFQLQNQDDSDQNMHPIMINNPSVSNFSEIDQKSHISNIKPRSRKPSISQSHASASTIQILQVNSIMSNSNQQNKVESKTENYVNQNIQKNYTTQKSYLKSLEQFMPCGAMTSSLYKDQLLSNQVQTKSFGRVINQRPISGISSNASMFTLSKPHLKENPPVIQQQYIKIIDDQNKQLQLTQYGTKSPKTFARPQTSIQRPKSIISTTPLSKEYNDPYFQNQDLKTTSNKNLNQENQIFFKRPITAVKNLRQASSQASLRQNIETNYQATTGQSAYKNSQMSSSQFIESQQQQQRPSTGMASIRSRIASAKLKEQELNSNFSLKNAISKHFDK